MDEINLWIITLKVVLIKGLRNVKILRVILCKMSVIIIIIIIIFELLFIMFYRKTYRCWRLGSWKILAGMVDRRLRFSRRSCRLFDRLVKQPVSSDEIRLLFRNLRCKNKKKISWVCFRHRNHTIDTTTAVNVHNADAKTFHLNPELLILTGSWVAGRGKSWPWYPQCCCSWDQVFPGRGRARAAPQRSRWSCCLLWKHTYTQSLQ